MKGCLLLVVGAILGAILLVVTETLVARPVQLPPVSATSSDLTILFRNQFLTRTLNSELGQVGGGVTFSRVVVQGQADQTILLVGTASSRAVTVSVPLRVTLHPSVSNNRVAIQVVRAEVGTLPLPPTLFNQLQGPINDEINRSLASAAYRIVNVTATVDGLVVDVVLTN